MKTGIIIKLNIEGLHHWPSCPIEEVKYLRDLHRHTFFITCKKLVSHDDRDIEIIQYKNKIREYLIEEYLSDKNAQSRMLELDFGARSCEMIAKELLEKFDLYYCQVLEDNENGAEIFID